jgi:hypothetical protein
MVKTAARAQLRMRKNRATDTDSRCSELAAMRFGVQVMTSANAESTEYHDRMPVIVDLADYSQGLDRLGPGLAARLPRAADEGNRPGRSPRTGVSRRRPTVALASVSRPTRDPGLTPPGTKHGHGSRDSR